MTLTLPYPPSNNRYYRHARGRTYLSTEGLSYRIAVVKHRPMQGCPLEGRLRLTIDVYPDRGVGQDLDNIPKAICDALQYANVYRNDNQIDELRLVRQPKAIKARVVVTLEEI
jgi:crossover junction endodeoxyribonuclease RusA